MLRRKRIIAGMLLLFLSTVAGLVLTNAVMNGDERVSLRQPTSRPPIVLVTIEATRPNHVGPCYGYDRETAPHICALAEDGVRFTHAYAQGSNTPTAIPSLLTSLPPNSAGLDGFSGEGQGQALNRSAPLLPGMLEHAGYTTLGVLGPRGGFPTVVQDWKPYNKETPRTRSHLWEWLSTHWSDPAFLWLFPNDPHYPLFPADQYRHWEDSTLSQAELFAFQRDHNRNRSAVGERIGGAGMIGLYDAEIRSADRRVGDVVRFLRENGVYRDAMIVVTADHGEILNDTGTQRFVWGHGDLPVKNLVHVPLVIKFPGNRFAGQRVERPVRHVDIAPTVYDVLGLATDAPSVGSSLLPAVQGKDSMRRTILSARRPVQGWSVRNETHTLFIEGRVGPACAQPDGTRGTLAVAGERRPVRLDDHAIAAALHRSMCDLYRVGERYRFPPSSHPRPGDVRERSRERLRELGYLE